MSLQTLHAYMFQSTPPHGGRRPLGTRSTPTVCFNPRPRTEGDPRSRPRMDQSRVSIHAPARRATFRHRTSITAYRCFNPRPRTEGDMGSVLCDVWLRLFQSTPPHGGRHNLHGLTRVALRFNPRPRTEGDPARRPCVRIRRRFNPRPRTEGDCSSFSAPTGNTTFQSTPPHGGRPAFAFDSARCSGVSIHAPARRATWKIA